MTKRKGDSRLVIWSQQLARITELYNEDRRRWGYLQSWMRWSANSLWLFENGLKGYDTDAFIDGWIERNGKTIGNMEMSGE